MLPNCNANKMPSSVDIDGRTLVRFKVIRFRADPGVRLRIDPGIGLGTTHAAGIKKTAPGSDSPQV